METDKVKKQKKKQSKGNNKSSLVKFDISVLTLVFKLCQAGSYYC